MAPAVAVPRPAAAACGGAAAAARAAGPGVWRRAPLANSTQARTLLCQCKAMIASDVHCCTSWLCLTANASWVFVHPAHQRKLLAPGARLTYSCDRKNPTIYTDHARFPGQPASSSGKDRAQRDGMALSASRKPFTSAAHRASPRVASSRPLLRSPAAANLQRRRAAPEETGEDLSGLLKDLERFQQRAPGAGGAGAAAGPAAAAGTGGSSSSAGGEAPSPLKETLDKILIADFFVVLAILGWLAAGLGLQGATGSSTLLDAWFPLWPLVFQPAIGVLMLGALVSGGMGWLKEQGDKKGA
ncbi:MAG: hypothetical protein J3K34DRAFT_527285 [Monoraphidium minutum]|nr:MAG: hypothetical protein J3K34DRAFT_527285 [Monoraphidium minutum]